MKMAKCISSKYVEVMKSKKELGSVKEHDEEMLVPTGKFPMDNHGWACVVVTIPHQAAPTDYSVRNYKATVNQCSESAGRCLFTICCCFLRKVDSK